MKTETAVVRAKAKKARRALLGSLSLGVIGLALTAPSAAAASSITEFTAGLQPTSYTAGMNPKAGTAFVAGGALALASSASRKTLQQICAEDVLKQPQIVTPPTGMYNAGKKSTSSTNNQETSVSLLFEGVDPACDGHFKRLPYFMPQLVRDGHTINLSPFWLTLFTRGYDSNVAGYEPGFSYNQPLVSPKYMYWRPSDKARFKLRIADLNLATRKVVATRVTTHRIKIVTRHHMRYTRHHPLRPTVSWTLPHTADEGQPIAFSWTGRHLGRGHRLVIQKPEGTAHTWRTIMRLNANSGSAELPGLALGQYRFRLADLGVMPRLRHGHRRRSQLRVLAQQAAGIAVFGQVPFSTLLDAEERTYVAPQFSFAYVASWNSLNAEADGNTTVFKVDHNNCLSAHIAFVPSTRGIGTGTLTLVQESREAVSATVPFNTIGSLDAELTPGQSWATNTEYKSSDQREVSVYVNGYALCDSAEPFN